MYITQEISYLRGWNLFAEKYHDILDELKNTEDET